MANNKKIKNSTTSSSGLERQDQFVASLADQNFGYGLVFTRAFLKGIRDIGYKNTATALFENIDNSIQAESGDIHIITGYSTGSTSDKKPDKIAIIDNGHGMSPNMIRASVLWGGVGQN